MVGKKSVISSLYIRSSRSVDCRMLVVFYVWDNVVIFLLGGVIVIFVWVDV